MSTSSPVAVDVVIIVVNPEVTTAAPDPEADVGVMQVAGMAMGAIGVVAAPVKM